MKARAGIISSVSLLLLAGAGGATDDRRYGDVTQDRVLQEADTGKNWLVNGGQFTVIRFTIKHAPARNRLASVLIG